MPTVLETNTAVWRRAKKTKGLKAKPLITLIVDKAVVNKFLIDTLEGREPIDSANMFCIGETGDAWQQTAKALLKKYDIISIDADGWMNCMPKPENEVEFFEVTDATALMAADGGYIVGLWGATIDGVPNLQAFVKGDFVCRQPHQHEDQWVVRRTLFQNSYTELGAR
jgi:hypothetical protein